MSLRRWLPLLRRDTPPMETAALPQPRAPRYKSLDLWRGVACLMVVVFHAIGYSPYYRALVAGTEPVCGEGWLNRLAHVLQAGLSELWLGVPMFFVISGYCISATLDSQRRKPLSVARYFHRRFRRIYPPYWIALALTAGCVALFYFTPLPNLFSDEAPPFYPWRLTPAQWLGNITLTETWRYHALGDPPGQFLGIMWTLCYEEQFYAVAGLILLLSPRRIFAPHVP